MNFQNSITCVAGPKPDTWVIQVSQTVEISTKHTPNGEKQTSVNERVEYWTGTNWDADPARAKIFDSKTECDKCVADLEASQPED